MSGGKSATVRAVALAGPCGSGKTTLLESMLHVAGALPRRGAVAAGTSLGDASEEARAVGLSTELNVARFAYLGDRYVVLDCPGSVDFAADQDAVLTASDIALVVADPDPDRAILLQPLLKRLDDQGIPHAIFINKIDKARGRLRDLLAALQPFSAVPLVARQIPIWRDGAAAGFIDLALERAFLYQPGQPSSMIEIPKDDAAREADARFHMLEQVAEFDDALFERLINDVEPEREQIFQDLVDELGQGVIAPVFLGSAETGAGVRRLLKALRHETPPLDVAAQRLGASDRSAYVLKIRHAGQAGRQTLVRAMGAEISDGARIATGDGVEERIAGVFDVQGESYLKRETAHAGSVVSLGRLEHGQPGDLLGVDGEPASTRLRPLPRRGVYALAIEPKNRQDDVKLSAAMARLIDEDPSLSFGPDPDSHEFRLAGQGEMHLRVTLDKLKRKFGVSVVARRPETVYRETIRGSAKSRGRHKKQSGGHGQFGDVVIEVRPAARGSGFSFDQQIHGGVVPKHYFGAVEQGVKDALAKGPLGFGVVDVEATLLDGSYHAVDSSEIAFRTAARIAASEALGQSGSVVLEPIYDVVIDVPSEALARVSAIIPVRRGRILGLSPREGWRNWESLHALLPGAELSDLILAVRSATRGLGELKLAFDHMEELDGRLAAGIADARERAAHAR